MKKAPLTLLIPLSLMIMSCNPAKDVKADDEQVITQAKVEMPDRRMTPEALWAMGRIGETAVRSQDDAVAYTVTYYSVEKNKSNNEIYLMDKSGNIRALTHDNIRRSNLAWSLDGKLLYYLSSESGSSQIWKMDVESGSHTQVSNYEKDIEGFLLSPDQAQVLLVCQVGIKTSTQDIYPDLDKTSGIIIDDLMYKHWDEYVTTVPHPFLSTFTPDGLGPAQIDILQDQPYESPMKPFGGVEQFAWSPDSQQFAFTMRAKTGVEYALSTNSDIYLYTIISGQVENITEEIKGYDTNPSYSPDGRFIAWQSMERDGYESDQNRLMVMDLKTKEKVFASKALDTNADAFFWDKDSEHLFLTAVWHGTEQIYKVSRNGGEAQKLTDGTFDYGSIQNYDGGILATRQSMKMADELYKVDLGSSDITKNATQLTHVNQALYDQMDFGDVEARWMKTTDGKDMLTWVIYPPHFDKTKKYPTLLFCEGGPQSPVSQFWSYRWNFQIMAANDYIIVAPNRRGLPGFGMEWNEQVSGDYSGQCMRDYLTAIDEMAKEPFVDETRLGCVGASFGGFSVYYLAGNHDGRFKAFIAHDGIFNMEAQYLETEEMWFANWDMGGAYWDKQNATAQRTFMNSPHKFVDKWDTPILCIHGEKDYRILSSQAMGAFAAARLRGVDARLLLFPDENHWVLKPQNGILWQRIFFDWLDKYLK